MLPLVCLFHGLCFVVGSYQVQPWQLEAGRVRRSRIDGSASALRGHKERVVSSSVMAELAEPDGAVTRLLGSSSLCRGQRGPRYPHGGLLVVVQPKPRQSCGWPGGIEIGSAHVKIICQGRASCLMRMCQNAMRCHAGWTPIKLLS